MALSGKSRDSLLEELKNRRALIEWLVKTGKTEYKEVATWIHRYYIDPVRTLREGPLYEAYTS
jgi:hypothetical protein